MKSSDIKLHLDKINMLYNKYVLRFLWNYNRIFLSDYIYRLNNLFFYRMYIFFFVCTI